MTAQPLIIEHLPLVGQQLIEASAGTGKTYNITRLYLRLLLERSLTVDQILVMTFTKDATEELKGRIEQTLYQALHQWDALCEAEPFFLALNERIDTSERQQILNQALLTLDEASIFTIHGFCHQVLNQYAFETGVSFNAQLQDDGSRLLQQACEDYYRQLAIEQPDNFRLLSCVAESPNAFIAQFKPLLITTDVAVEVVNVVALIERFLVLVQNAIACLTTYKTQFFSWLVDGKNTAEQEKRAAEYTELTQAFEHIELILQQVLTQPEQQFPTINPIKNSFFDGRRYSRAKFKTELNELIQPISELLKQYSSWADQYNKARAMQLVYAAIAPIKQRYEQQKQQRQLLTFDDLISRLATILSSTDGHNLAQQLYQQYPVALVDEFQDTDAQQYQILQAIYHQPDDAGLFLIGDPKQAIYGFRGGDIFTYLAAKLHCDGQWFMNTNWRSSTNMITAYNRLFYGAPLHEASADVFGFGIEYQPVEPSPSATVDDEPALHFIHFEPSAELIDSNGAVKASYRTVMAAWCAEKIVSLLNKQQLTSGDIAILVRDSTEAREIKQALHERQLPSVFLSTRDNLYQSNESYALLRCLKGILYLEDDQQFTAALASDLIQLPASQLYSLQQDPMAWQRRKTEFLSLRQCWQQQSFITMALTLLHQQSHMVSEQNERALTNYLHLFELLQQASKQHPQPDALIYWFENQIQQTDNQAEAELRLESDENLIKIVTQHGSKGLEYHTVFIPFATRFNHPLKHGSKYVSLLTYHDAQQLRFHLGMDTEIAELHQREALAETIRLFYVAVTRAKSQCYILSAPFAQYDQSPLGLTLQLAEGEPLATKLQQLVHSITPTACLEIIEQDEITQCTHYEHKQQHQAVQVAQFHGKIERDWWLSSFSALTRQLAHSSVSIPDHDYLPLDQQMSHVAVDSIQFKLKKGAQTGNYLHYLFENMAFNQQPDSEWLTRSSLKFGLLLTEQEISELQQWLQQILTTDLAPNNFSLQQISPKACLKEVEFYFPMQGGKQQQLVKLLTAHRHQVHQQLAEQYGEQYRTIMPVELPSYHQLKGMMHGFIDLVFEHDGRYFVLDYKSSFLGEQLKDYHPVALTLHAEQNYYDLQYLIYCLALDKYLAQRVDNYDSAKHFGGVYYLYLRGMQAQQTYGILHAQLPPEIFSQLRTIFYPQVNQATK